MKLSDLGEFGFIEKVRGWLPESRALVGLGDDAAVIDVGGRRLVATSDAMVEGTHFRLDWSAPADVGFKAVSVNVSDLAAMGAEPQWLLLSLAAPASVDEEVLAGIYAGIGEACEAYGTELVGGDTVRSSQLVLAVTALGSLEGDPLLRSGAKAGDVLAVTGPLGRSTAGMNLLLKGDADGRAEMACVDAHRRPVAKVAEGRGFANAGVHACIDMSDGLSSDATRLAEASGVAVEVDVSRVPIADEVRAVADSRGWDAMQMVLAGGEDLELLVALPQGEADALGLIAFGRVIDGEGAWLVRDGSREPLSASGWDHFR